MPKISGPFHSLFYPDYNGDRLYSDEDFGLPFKLDHSNGVYLNQSTQALQIVAAVDMNLTIRAGYCFIEGHFGGTPMDGSITLDNADGSYPRIDRIVMRHYGSGGELDERKLAPLVLTGIPAQNPKAPDIVRNGTYYDLSLATVLVPAGTIEITAANITDTRFDTSVCGAVTGNNVNPLDTTELFSQFSAAFYELMEQIHDTLGQDAAANLLNLINAQTQRLTDYEGKTDTKIATLESTSASHASTLSSHSTIISRLNKKRVEKILTINSGVIGNKEVIYTPLKPFSEFAMLILYVGGSATNYYRYTGTPSYTETTTVTVNEAVPLTYLVDRLDSKDQSLLVYGKYELYNEHGDGKTIKSDGFLNFYAGSSNATISINNIKVFNKPYSYHSGNINAKITVYGVR